MSLIVEDDFIKKSGELMDDLSNDLFWIINGYQSVLETVAEDGIKQGATADALKEFSRQVKSSTGKNSSTAFLIGDECKRYCDGFIMRVDSDDKDLY